MDDAPILTTPRLELRRFNDSVDDAELLVALHGDARVMRYIDDGKPMPRERVVGETIPAMLREYAALPVGLGKSAVFEKASGEFVGWVGLSPASSIGLEAGEALELGYRLRPAMWGTGYASEAARAIVDLAFGNTGLGVQRIVATTMTVNAGSRRVMEKAGLQYVRTFFEEWPEYIEGAEHGDVVYELSAKAWADSDRVQPPGQAAAKAWAEQVTRE